MAKGGLTDVLLKIGAPFLKEIIQQSLGANTISGRLAGSAIDVLAEKLGAKPDPDSIAEAIEKDPAAAAPIVQEIDAEFSRAVQSTQESMRSYHEVLLTDAKSEGIISRLWRPLFAIIFTICFALQVITILWLMWTRQLGTLTQLGEVTTFLTFLDVAGCAVLGVYVWKRTDEKKEGV